MVQQERPHSPSGDSRIQASIAEVKKLRKAAQLYSAAPGCFKMQQATKKTSSPVNFIESADADVSYLVITIDCDWLNGPAVIR